MGCVYSRSFVGRNLKICSDRYQFKITDVLSGDVNFDNVIKQFVRMRLMSIVIGLLGF